MGQAIQFTTPSDHYDFRKEKGCCILWCTDARFTPALDKFVAERGYMRYDLIRIAGGANVLATPEGDGARFVIGQFGALHNLHHFDSIILMMHQDCGACGGSKAFGDDCARELQDLNLRLSTACKAVRDSLPSIKVETVLVTFKEIISIPQPVL
ncbi:MAG: hypothetical protein WC845_02745 [Candidatus Staskawiczbacteria bacterium]|jgi:hypothetical protein